MAVTTFRCIHVFFVIAILLSFPSRQVLAGRKSQTRQRGTRLLRHCPDDMFDDQLRRPQNSTALNCRPCSHCLPGFGVQRLCTWTEDTQCVPCRDGHYSESSDMWGDCLKCRQCGRNQGVRRTCTRSSNTVCSQNCAHGYFFSPYDRDCLPCSPCRQPGDRDTGVVAAACRAAGMNRDMQCWPTHSHSDPTSDSQSDLHGPGGDTTELEGPTGDENRPISTTSKTDNQSPSIRPSTGPGDGDTILVIDKEAAELYTIILLTLLCVVGLCIILSVAVLVCLGRLMKLTGSASRRKEKNGYHCLSKKTANLLVRGTAHV